jgi:UDP-N-acetylglucosamine 2-epimerase (non-hydrolysing)
LVLRETSERPEVVETGAVRVVGTDRTTIVESAVQLLTDEGEYRRMAEAVNPYGDGYAARRIVQHILPWHHAALLENRRPWSVPAP